MDWNKAHNIYTTIQIYDKQIRNLTKLADQIAEDRKGIEIDISHVLASTQKKPSNFMKLWVESHPAGKYASSTEETLDIGSFNMELNDQYALEFIGGMLHVLQKQRERLQEKLTKMEQNNV